MKGWDGKRLFSEHTLLGKALLLLLPRRLFRCEIARVGNDYGWFKIYFTGRR